MNDVMLAVITLGMVAALCAVVIAVKRVAVKTVKEDGGGRVKNKWAREGIAILGGVVGVIFVRAFLLDPVEKVGFAMVMNNLDKLGSSDMKVVLNSSTFWKCSFGFIIGAVIAGMSYKRFQKGTANTPPQSSPPLPAQQLSIESKMEELKRLRDKELISAEDFDRKKAELIKNL